MPILKVFFILLVCSLNYGCAGNGYKTYFKPSEIMSNPENLMSVDLTATSVNLHHSNTFNEDSMRAWIERSYVLLGQSAFSGPLQPESTLRKFALEIGASDVVYNSTYMNTRTGAVPMTMNTPTTSYTSGNVYSSYGSASYSGTTYGTQTSTYMMPYSVDRYSQSALFFAPWRGTPRTGVWPVPLTPEQKRELGRNDGVYVFAVLENSPASRAGVINGDFVIKIDSMKVNDLEHYMDLVKSKEGQQINMELLRNGKIIKKALTVNIIKPVNINPVKPQ